MGHKVIIYYVILFISVISVIMFSAAPNSFGTHHGDDGLYVEPPGFLDPDFTYKQGSCPDTDGDKLCNSWELNSGLQITRLTKTYFYGCDQYGPDSECPRTNYDDIYVEIDYMKGHAPDTAALLAVNGSFFDNGVTLHLQVDEEIKKIDGTGYHKQSITTPIDIQTGTEFDIIKNGVFGELSYRQADTTPNYNDYLTAKRQAFHYAMFIHNQSANPGVSGKAELQGNDIIISLGAFSNEVGSTSQQAGTLMHELGHNLGLRHGGNNDDDCKPNYLSVMNHAYQFSASPNYASNPAGAFITLNEGGGLVELDGIGTGGWGKTVVWSGGAFFTVPEDGPSTINWDGGSISTTPPNFQLNSIPSLGCLDTTFSQLANYNDWANLNYNLRTNSFFSDGVAVEVAYNETLAEEDLPDGEPIPDELTNEAITNILLERIHSIRDVLESSKTQYSQDSLEQKIKNNELEQALQDLKALPPDEKGKIKYIVELLESATKHSDPITGKYEKYYNKNGILSGPTKQVSNGIPLTDEICKPDYRMLRLDKDHSKDTQSEAVCIKYASLVTFIKLKKDFVVADNGLCDGFFSQRETFKENKDFLDSLDNATSTDGSKLNCSEYFAQFDA